MKNYSLIIGIDISKLTLDITGINFKNDIVLQHQVIENNKTKIKCFLKKVIAKYSKENIVISFGSTFLYILDYSS